jgi:hypothetical protein
LSYSVRISAYLGRTGAVREDYVHMIDSVLQEELTVVLFLVQPYDCVDSTFVELRQQLIRPQSGFVHW